MWDLKGNASDIRRLESIAASFFLFHSGRSTWMRGCITRDFGIAPQVFREKNFVKIFQFVQCTNFSGWWRGLHGLGVDGNPTVIAGFPAGLNSYIA